ncbi:hypothetical protein AAFP30_27945 [Gordonia sp. CPCC 205515]|uniref:hypothetical protein n=1 Tax=Gordonia sp. CPCC 205515 TaxID=3140791 RepID=UPI003AF3490B
MSSTAHEWDTAATAVADHADTLTTAHTHREIRAWAEEHGLISPSMWTKIRTELRKQHDIDYDQLRAATLRRESSEVAAAAADAPTVVLCVAGDAEIGTYAICPPHNDHESWYGTFHPKDKTYKAGDDQSAELSAAQKAVFLAGKLREHLDVPALGVTILTTHPDLAAEDITADAVRARVAVTVEHVEENPAVALVRAPGYRQWREIKLPNLLGGYTT